MPLDTRKVAHIQSNRDKIRLGRTETLVLVSAAGGVITYQAVAGCVLNEVGAVPAGIANRVGEITRASYDALGEFPSNAIFPTSLRLIARTPTPTSAAVATADKFTVLDRRRLGLGTTGSGGGLNTGDRWQFRLRRVR